VRGVAFTDGTEVTAPIVVSACNPHETFLAWLRNPPASAQPLIDRWRAIPHDQGYESKIDAIVSAPPRLRALESLEALGLVDQPLNATTIISPSLAEIHRGFGLMASGQVLPNPGMFLNMPSMVDPSMAPPGKHVFSLETLYTPYSLRGGWPESPEPRRWLERFASLTGPNLTGPGFLDTIDDWRAMTPDRYEREFHLPAGHATSFSGGPLAALRNANPELTRYQTPIEGLYLTGAATFPGAGVWGASGRNAALTVLKRR
jgi:phytoene dehydrogenase-like protein